MISDAQILFYIHDMDNALAFYKNAINLKSTSESPYWSTLRINDGLELALHPNLKERDPNEPHPFNDGKTTLSLTVDDLESYIARIEKHGGRLEQIIEPEGGRRSRMGLVFDPSGNGFQINQIVL